MKKTYQSKSLSILLRIFTILVITMTALTGCGRKSETEPLPTLVGDSAAASLPTPEPATTIGPDTIMLNGIPAIGERVIVDGQMQSYLTGEWKDAEVASRRPIAAVVINTEKSLPQYGLSQASIIYEAVVEGRITRLMPVFEDFDDLDHIGPVRGCRDYQVYVAAGYEAIFCNWGLAVPYVEKLINSDVIDNVSAGVYGIEQPADEAYMRIQRGSYLSKDPDYSSTKVIINGTVSFSNRYPLEYTGYVQTNGIRQAVKRLSYDWNYSDHYVPQFTFAADNTRAEYAGQPEATMIYPGGTEKNNGGYGIYNPWFEYHAEDGLYYRYQSGEKMIDELNGEQYAVSNVVLQYSHGEVRDDKDYLAFEVHGEGDALIFTNGKVVEGTWLRYDGDGTPAKFYDKEGNEIIFNQGKTWICNIWEEYGEFVLYK